MENLEAFERKDISIVIVRPFFAATRSALRLFPANAKVGLLCPSPSDLSANFQSAAWATEGQHILFRAKKSRQRPSNGHLVLTDVRRFAGSAWFEELGGPSWTLCWDWEDCP